MTDDLRERLTALRREMGTVVSVLLRKTTLTHDEHAQVTMVNKWQAELDAVLAVAREPQPDSTECGRCGHTAFHHANLGKGDCQVPTGCDCYEFKQSAAASEQPEPPPRELLSYPRLLELCDHFGIDDADTLKHRLEDWARWRDDIRHERPFLAASRAPQEPT